MARQVTVHKVDDFDGTPATHTFEFTDDDTTYTIDLNRAHTAEFRSLLKPYKDAAFSNHKADADTRKRTSKADNVMPAKPKRRTPNRGGPGGGTDQGAIRAWARANGHEVNRIGSIPTALRDTYYAAQKSSRNTA